ncbi:MAG: hypothetical protein RMJ37_06625 [Spirochaetia bacterium]|nr:hypothetical protein [Spirochaetota bacterium]MCX8096872.1 hypothetical protein [Spirochaetota bacterium]MDW8112989.1 hypothetical protein [Spirochaetia bacterium]
MKNIFQALFVVLLISSFCYGVPPYMKNEIAIIPQKEKLTLSLEIIRYQRKLQNMSNYNILSVELEGDYTPNNFIEVGFGIPYLKILESSDSGIIGDIGLYSKFVILREIFSILDNFLLQNALVINIYLATGIKKEDSYRNIGLQKGLYFPISSGYADIEIGNTVSVVGTVFGISLFFSFNSVSSKIEPPLAFNVENDHLVLGSTLEGFVYYSEDLTIKLFSEITYFLPISERSKYLNILDIGGGVWGKVIDVFIIKVGYYQNFLIPIDIEKTYDSILMVELGTRF